MNNNTSHKSLMSLFKSLWVHISKRRKVQFSFLLILTLVASVAEVASLGAVLPFIGILTQPDQVFESPWLAGFINFFEISSGDELILPLTIAFGLAAIIAGVLRLLLLWVSIRLSNATGADLSIEVYKRTLYQPFRVHLERSSSEIISGITQKVSAATGVLLAATAIITSFFLFGSIITTMIIVDPLVTIVAGISFGFAYACIAFVTSKKFELNSISIAAQQTQVVKALQEGLGAIRDVILDATQRIYTAIYQKAILLLMRANGENRFMNQAPRYAMESLGMVLIAMFVLALTNRPGGVTAALPLLGMLALGAQRLLPLMQQIYGNWSVVAGSHAALNDVVDLLDQPFPQYYFQNESQPLEIKDSFSVNKLSFRYNESSPWVLDDISFKIMKGSRIGLIGSTGSGKSTTLDLLMGLLEPTHGELMVDNMKIDDRSIRAWRQTVAHVPQSIFLADTSIAENIAFGVAPENINMPQVKDAAKKAMIDNFIESRPNGYSEVVGERGVRLSGGQRQRIGIARALYKKANVIVFDEATSALDNETEKVVMEAIRNLGEELTLIIVAHRLSTLENCTHIIELDQGKILRIGSYDEIINHARSTS
ncbi:ABC transporter ATP-binding protein/permease [Gammaproteobacteria bacterium]|jgi:ATP-binding cassette subfamily B protein|nr:ABC transporter ATP-binding protein/permease [Gammaproteobacteria bacterium]|tara:strand:- start:4597 stop:6390 length:1794 start_codon:yes stop_codon:yes gene_type:complete